MTHVVEVALAAAALGSLVTVVVASSWARKTEAREEEDRIRRMAEQAKSAARLREKIARMKATKPGDTRRP